MMGIHRCGYRKLTSRYAEGGGEKDKSGEKLASWTNTIREKRKTGKTERASPNDQMPPSGAGSSCLAVLPFPRHVLTALMFARYVCSSVP